MTYWKKKTSNGTLYQCMGTTKAGDRCKKKMYLVPETVYVNKRWVKQSQDVLCSSHKSQIINYKHSTITDGLKNVFIMIMKYIDCPKSFINLSKVCVSSAKASHSLQIYIYI